MHARQAASLPAIARAGALAKGTDGGHHIPGVYATYIWDGVDTRHMGIKWYWHTGEVVFVIDALRALRDLPFTACPRANPLFPVRGA